MESKDIVIKFNGEYIDAVAHYDDNGYHGRGGYGTKLAALPWGRVGGPMNKVTNTEEKSHDPFY